MAYKNIVVGSDGSATAEKAVREAAELASTSSARLIIVTAFEAGNDLPHDELPADVRWKVNGANEAEARAQAGRKIAHDAGATDVVIQAVAGEAAERMLDAVDDFGADLIVVGSVGLTGAARFVLGSVASSVAHHAPCDVLVVQTA